MEIKEFCEDKNIREKKHPNNTYPTYHNKIKSSPTTKAQVSATSWSSAFLHHR